MDSKKHSRRVLQNVLLVWLDSNSQQLDHDVRHTSDELRALVHDISVFTDRDDCLQFLSAVEHEKVLLISSGFLANNYMEKLHSIKSIEAIYIYCDNPDSCHEWSYKWSKIKGVHDHIQPIKESLRSVVKQSTENITPISFVTSSSSEEQTEDVELNRLEPSFMYTQFFKRIFLVMPSEAHPHQSLVQFCRQQYIDNPSELRVIEEFDQTYHHSKAVWWYTRECFTYQLLNRALRCLEADIVVDMGFFIRDLHQQIEILHKQQLPQYEGRSLSLYRGQGLTIEAFLKLKKSRGQLLSFNSFLSTSKLRPISFSYARCASFNENMVGILFIMKINPDVSTTPFADIHEYSYIETEAEIIFSMHTVFRIDKIDTLNENERLFEVHLTMTGDDDPILRCLMDRIDEEVTNDNGWERIGQLLIQVEQLNKAEELFQTLLKNASTPIQQGNYLNQLGLIKNRQGDYKTAVDYYEQAISLHDKRFSSADANLASTYNNLAAAYKNMEEYSKSLTFYEKALYIEKKILPSNHPSLATSFNNIGLLYMTTEHYVKAIQYYNYAITIFEHILPPNHPSLASSYNNVGLLYDHMGEYLKSLSFYQKALAILERTLPENHSDLGTSYNNLAVTYYKLDEYSKAHSFFQKALDIFRSSLPANHPNIQTVLDWIDGLNRKLQVESKTASARH